MLQTEDEGMPGTDQFGLPSHVSWAGDDTSMCPTVELRSNR
jgi:hypothetical protein